jgi:hypothetical protein
VTTTATQAAQDMLERLGRAAALFGGADDNAEREASADSQDGMGDR